VQADHGGNADPHRDADWITDGQPEREPDSERPIDGDYHLVPWTVNVRHDQRVA
jgi:hypothetical protein